MNDIYHLSLKLLEQKKTNATKTWDPMLLHVVWNAPCAQEDSHCTQAFQLELPQFNSQRNSPLPSGKMLENPSKTPSSTLDLSIQDIRPRIA